MKRIISSLLIATCLLGLVGCGNTTKDPTAPIEPTEESSINIKSETRKLTLEDVIEISKKGEDVDWVDFEEFEFKDIGSGLFVYKYDINDEYHLLMGGAQSSKPLYAYLVHKTKNQIDIRYENVEEFLAAEKSEEDETQPVGTPADEVFDITVSYANWGGLNEIYSKALNIDKMAISSVRHLPIYKFDTLAELKQFKNDVKDVLSIDAGYDEMPSFNESTTKYDENFFAENTLMLVYVEATSGSYRYGVDSVYHANSNFYIHVKQTNNPEIHTDDMSGWFITVAVPDSMVADCTTFDADFQY